MGARTIGEDAVLELTDGRQLGYVLYGDPTGFPVLSCPGGLVCRLDASSSHQAALDLGVLLISPDRPGVGLSDRQGRLPDGTLVTLEGEGHMIGITHRPQVLERLLTPAQTGAR